MAEKTLKHLFDIVLLYQEGKMPVSIEGKIGEYIGSGEGIVSGPKLNGKVHWTLFEAQTPTICQSNLFGLITTDDGATIEFDSMGVFMVPDKKSPHRWHTSAGVSFQTDNDRYSWLNPILAVWDGEFDMKAHQHKYQVFSSQT